MHQHHGHEAYHHRSQRDEHSLQPTVASHVAFFPELAIEKRTASVEPEPPSRVLVARASTTCGANDDTGMCQKPTNLSTVPIVLGVAIPLTIAVVVLLFLHRRHRKKLVQEDNDRHKSLDFGMDGSVKKSKGKRGPSMMFTGEKQLKSHGRGGLSLDMDLSSPYLLPAGLQQSRESFHSLSRSVQDDNDPYRPVAFVKGSEDPYGRSRGENSSIYTKSSVGTDNTSAHLLRQSSFPARGDSRGDLTPRSQSTSPQELAPPPVRFPDRAHPGNQSGSSVRSPSPLGSSVSNLYPGQATTDRDSYFDQNAEAPSAPAELYTPSSVSPPAPTVAAREPVLPELDSTEKKAPPSPPRVNGLPANPRPPRLQSMQASVHTNKTASMISDTSDYGDNFKVTPPSPPRPQIVEPEPRRHSIDAPMIVTQESQNAAPGGLTVREPGFDNKRMSMTIRPLPRDDPTDNPEQRANRIRSFYKEYFDDSKPDPVGHYEQDDYMEDYGAEYMAAGPMYNSQSGDFAYPPPMPYAEPMARRAMTPPPRAPPRGHQATGSTGTGRFMPPRGQSAMSGRHVPRPNIPPPPILTSLPTPHKLKDDAMVFNPLDFAPPTSFRDRQNGRRSDSPLGTERPYSPSVRSHVPLESAFAELAPMPSPHMLRKSGTFTALDFAPPPRFKTSDVGSDTASIRSNGSGMSAAQLHSLRAGAYRVSRVPKELAGTRDDLYESLRPKLDLVTPA